MGYALAEIIGITVEAYIIKLYKIRSGLNKVLAEADSIKSVALISRQKSLTALRRTLVTPSMLLYTGTPYFTSSSPASKQKLDGENRTYEKESPYSASKFTKIPKTNTWRLRGKSFTDKSSKLLDDKSKSPGDAEVAFVLNHRDHR